MSPVNSSLDIEKLRTCGAINAAIHRQVYNILRAGISTREINEFAGKLMAEEGVTSSIIEEGFPGCICISRNEEVGHGVPGSAVIQAGDVVTVDIAISYQGFHTDCAQSYIVEAGSGELFQLLRTAKKSLWAGIRKATADSRCSDISAAVYEEIAGQNYSAVRRVFGHGIGEKLHEPPSIANYGPEGFGQRLCSGTALAIEPILSLGSPYTFQHSNGWTDITVDGQWSVHFEHTVLVTQGEPEVLTTGAENSIFTVG